MDHLLQQEVSSSVHRGFLSMGREVEVLARVKDEPVMVKQERHMACTFHPELSSNNYVHQYFLDLIQKPVLA